MTAPSVVGSLFEAPEPSVIGSAMEWCLSLVSGPLVTAIATVAVAGIGFALLAGRLPMRRAVTVVVGIFLMAGAGSATHTVQIVTSEQESSTAPLPSTPRPVYGNTPSPNAFDPYAGASVQTSR